MTRYTRFVDGANTAGTGVSASKLNAALDTMIGHDAVGWVSAKDYGAIADGASHPLSSIFFYLGQATTGWTLAQWQTIFPFATALTNEIDACALYATVLSAIAAGKAIYAPAGYYRINFGLTESLAVGQCFNFRGEAMSATVFEVAGEVSMFTITTDNATDTSAWLAFRDFTAYQAQAGLVGGTFLTLKGSNGAAAAAGQGPSFHMRDVFFGCARGSGLQTNGFGVFSPAVDLYGGWNPHITDCHFVGIYSVILGGDNGRNGMGLRCDGYSPAILGFGPDFLACEFTNLDVPVLIGNGTTAHVQGVTFDTCTFAACNEFVQWIDTTSITVADDGNDYLSMVNCNGVSYRTGVNVDAGITVTLDSNYFLSTSGKVVYIRCTSNKAQIVSINGNQFTGYGGVVTAIQIDGNTNVNEPGSGQTSIGISGNDIFDYFATGAQSIVLGPLVHGALIGDNNLVDSVEPTDGSITASLPQGLNIWSNNIWGQSATGQYVHFLSGVPGPTSFNGLYSGRQINAALGGVGGINPDVFNYRMVGPTISSGWRNDDDTTQLLLTARGQPAGGFSTLRPFGVDNTTGQVSLDGTGAGVKVGGPITEQGPCCVTVTPASGATLQVPGNCSTYVIDNTATLASLAINLNPVTVTGGGATDLRIIFLNAVSALAWTSSNGSFLGASLPSAAQAGTTVNLTFLSALGGEVHVIPA